MVTEVLEKVEEVAVEEAVAAPKAEAAPLPEEEAKEE